MTVNRSAPVIGVVLGLLCSVYDMLIFWLVSFTESRLSSDFLVITGAWNYAYFFLVEGASAVALYVGLCWFVLNLPVFSITVAGESQTTAETSPTRGLLHGLLFYGAFVATRRAIGAIVPIVAGLLQGTPLPLSLQTVAYYGVRAANIAASVVLFMLLFCLSGRLLIGVIQRWRNARPRSTAFFLAVAVVFLLYWTYGLLFRCSIHMGLAAFLRAALPASLDSPAGFSVSSALLNLAVTCILALLAAVGLAIATAYSPPLSPNEQGSQQQDCGTAALM